MNSSRAELQFDHLRTSTPSYESGEEEEEAEEEEEESRPEGFPTSLRCSSGGVAKHLSRKGRALWRAALASNKGASLPGLLLQ